MRGEETSVKLSRFMHVGVCLRTSAHCQMMSSIGGGSSGFSPRMSPKHAANSIAVKSAGV